MEQCKITCANNGKTLDAYVMSFTEGKFLTVVIAEMKINMKFNGKVYEGKSAGMDFTSNGPKIIKQFKR